MFIMLFVEVYSVCLVYVQEYAWIVSTRYYRQRHLFIKPNAYSSIPGTRMVEETELLQVVH